MSLYPSVTLTLLALSLPSFLPSSSFESEKLRETEEKLRVVTKRIHSAACFGFGFGSACLPFVPSRFKWHPRMGWQIEGMNATNPQLCFFSPRAKRARRALYNLSPKSVRILSAAITIDRWEGTLQYNRIKSDQILRCLSC